MDCSRLGSFGGGASDPKADQATFVILRKRIGGRLVMVATMQEGGCPRSGLWIHLDFAESAGWTFTGTPKIPSPSNHMRQAEDGAFILPSSHALPGLR